MTTYFSNFITFSRLPIIIGVVCIHAGFSSNQKILYFILGENFGRIAVPLFFFISGYLFFQKYSPTKSIYFEKIKKRVHSLLIPYLLWNLIAYLVYSFVTKTMSFDQFFQAFWVVAGKCGHSPADGPLWFIRSLMIYSISAPLFYLLSTKKLISWSAPFFIFAWLIQAPGFNSGFAIGFTFFNFGAWFAIKNLDKTIPIPSKKNSLIISFFYILGLSIHYLYKDSAILHNSLILCGFFLIYSLPQIYETILEKIPKVLTNKKNISLSSLSFGLYCMHEIILELIRTFHLIPFHQGNVNYCLSIFTTLFISLSFSILLQMIFPRTSTLLLGYRVNSKISLH